MDNLKIRLVHPSYNLKELLFFNYFIQKYVDTLIIGSNGSVKAHSTILAEKNDVFKNLLTCQEHKEEKVVNLPQFSIEVLKVIIEFMYRGDSRYFKEIEKEVKSAVTYFFETPKILSDSDCVEIKPVVPVVILSDSDNDEKCDSSQSYPRNEKNETNIQQTTRTKSPPTRKRRILNDTEINEIDSTLNGYVIKNKKKRIRSKSKPSQSNPNESIVNLSPLKHLAQVSVIRKKKLEESEAVKKDLFKTLRLSEEGSNKRHVNPFASSTMKPSNNLELQVPSNQEDALNTKNNRVNILDHTIVESPIIDEYATQSPEFLIDEPTIINDYPTVPPIVNLQESPLTNAENPSVNVSQELESLDEFSTNISQEFTNIEEIGNCRNISQGLMQTAEAGTTASQQPTQMDCSSSPELDVCENPSSPEIDVGHNSCNSTTALDALSDEHAAPKEATTSKNQSKTSPEPTNKESSNHSERQVIRNRIAYNSSDDEPPTISTSEKLTLKKPLKDDKTRSKKSKPDDETKSKKSENSIWGLLNKKISFQEQICVVCKKEVNDFPKHFDKKHHSLSKTFFPCTKCSHKFFFKYNHDEHQAYCTNNSPCKCLECKPY